MAASAVLTSSPTRSRKQTASTIPNGTMRCFTNPITPLDGGGVTSHTVSNASCNWPSRPMEPNTSVPRLTTVARPDERCDLRDDAFLGRGLAKERARDQDGNDEQGRQGKYRVIGQRRAQARR